ncbi:MAG: MetS family NSS transporter small subunit [Cellulosilyticaceae bacterium]
MNTSAILFFGVGAIVLWGGLVITLIISVRSQ